MPQINFIWGNTLHVSEGLSVHHQELTPHDGRKDRPKHVECHSKIK